MLQTLQMIEMMGDLPETKIIGVVPYVIGEDTTFSITPEVQKAAELMEKILINELKKRNIKKTKAYYTAAIALATPYGIYTTHGFMYGDVISEMRGNNGFGYDPMFIPQGFNKTLGELADSVKQGLSHRSKALSLAKVLLKTLV